MVFRGPRSAALTEWPSRVATIKAVLRLDRTQHWYNYRQGDRAVFVDDTVRTVLRVRKESGPLRRIRVAAHVHSSWSYDGRWSLSQIAATFGRLGYDAILLAEHDRGFDAERWSAYRRACADASTESMLLVPGLEYSDASNSVHVPVWGDVPFFGEGV